MIRLAPLLFVLACNPDTPDGADPATDSGSDSDSGTQTDSDTETEEVIDEPSWTSRDAPHGSHLRWLASTSHGSYLVEQAAPEKVWAKRDGEPWARMPVKPFEGAYSLPMFEMEDALYWPGSGGLHVSEDDGASWQWLDLGWEDGNTLSEGTGTVSSIKQAGAADGTIYVVRHVDVMEDYRLMEEWAEVHTVRPDGSRTSTEMTARSMVVSPASDVWRAVTSFPQRLCTSDDQGSSWDCEERSTPGYSIYEVDVGLVTVGAGVFVSKDGGESWVPRRPYGMLLWDSQVAGGVLYVMEAQGRFPHIHRLDDDRLVEIAPPPVGNEVNFDLVEFEGRLAAASSEGLHVLQDDGSWVQSSPLLAPVHRVVGEEGRLWFATGQRVHLSHDEGYTHEVLDLQDKQNGSGNQWFQLTPRAMVVHRDQLWVGGGRNKVWSGDLPEVDPNSLRLDLSTFRQVNWIAQRQGAVYAALDGAMDVNHGTGRRVAMGGGLWTFRENGPVNLSAGLPGVYDDGGTPLVKATYVYAEEGLLIVATAGGPRRSVNGGTTWQIMNGIQDYDGTRQTSRIVRHGDQLLMAVQGPGGLSLRRSVDGSEWAVVNHDLPVDFVLGDLVVHGADVVIGGRSGGVARSEDGVTWARLGSADVPAINDLQVIDEEIVAATARGIWYWQ